MGCDGDLDIRSSQSMVRSPLNKKNKKTGANT